MAAALTAVALGVDQNVTITGSGFTPATGYTITIVHGSSGGVDNNNQVTSDGAGAFTYSYVADGPGLDTISVDPTTPVITATTTVTVPDAQ